MKNFIEKFDQMVECRQEIDSYVWEIAERYMKDLNCRMTYVHEWREEDGSIMIHGETGAMGCYDPDCVHVPLQYFIDYEGATKARLDFEAKEKAKQAEEKKKQKQEAKKQKERRERELYEKLRAKFEN